MHYISVSFLQVLKALWRSSPVGMPPVKVLTVEMTFYSGYTVPYDAQENRDMIQRLIEPIKEVDLEGAELSSWCSKPWVRGTPPTQRRVQLLHWASSLK